ncbi:MAG: adenylyl-sulfate kinase, partial [Planctomycetales bacterium]|nr:adenylyl-sulfate kinase [Planctomycetales bacterium]
ATGASTADLAIVLIDARKGVLTQTRRHSFICSLLGIRNIVLAVNKIDLVGHDLKVFDRIVEDYREFAQSLGFESIVAIPMSARYGDNVTAKSDKMPWYNGPTLLGHLETVPVGDAEVEKPFRFPVQYVNRPNLDFRGFCGTIASGVVRQGDEVMALPSGKKSRVKSIVSYGGELSEAVAPLAVTLTLEDEIDVSRGDTIVHPGNVPRVDAKFDAMVVWMHEDAMVPGKQYLFKQCNKVTPGAISTLRYRVDVNTLHRQDAPTLQLNEIGRCQLRMTQPFIFDAYRRNRGMGSFIIIDRMTNATVGAGMILDRATSEDQAGHWDDQASTPPKEASDIAVTTEQRHARFGQRPCTLLLTGLPGAGKSTIAAALERRLFDTGRAVTVLDGQSLRQGISRDLGFSAQDRSENLRRGAEVARLMNDAGLICITAFVAPQEDIRQRAKGVVGADQFLVIHLSAPVDICRQRDQEGLYGAADAGEIADFPGVSFAYESPSEPDLVLATDTLGVEECVDRLVALLDQRDFI